MPDRDESRDLYVQFMGLEVVHCGGTSTITESHRERFTRYAPHSDLEAAEREIERMCEITRNLEAEHKIARKCADAATRDFAAISKALRSALKSIEEAIDKTVPF